MQSGEQFLSLPRLQHNKGRSCLKQYLPVRLLILYQKGDDNGRRTVRFEGLCRFDSSPKGRGHIDESEIGVEMLSGTKRFPAPTDSTNPREPGDGDSRARESLSRLRSPWSLGRGASVLLLLLLALGLAW